MLRSLFARVDAFKDYSVTFEEHHDGLYCIVRTWDDAELQSICVRVEALGQRVPCAELSCLSRILDSVISCQLPISLQGASPTLTRVLSDNRVDGRTFVMYSEFDTDVFLQCYRQADQAVFGMLEVISMIDFLLLRLRGALQESWMEDVINLRQCVIVGRVEFPQLRGVIVDLLSIWEFVRVFVRCTGPKHLRSATDRVIVFCRVRERGGFVFSFPFMFLCSCNA